MKFTLEHIAKYLLYIFLIVFPFNLVVGKIFPSLVSLPFFIADCILLFCGIIVIIYLIRKQMQFEKEQYIIVGSSVLFILLGIITIITHFSLIKQFILTHDIQENIFLTFKQIISRHVVQSIAQTLHTVLGLVLFIFVLQISVKKEQIIKILCIPLIIILVINLGLAIFQQDVSLDGGMVDSFITPYQLSETGRIYFPFVNSLLLSCYLSCMLFLVFYLFITTKKQHLLFGLGFLLFITIFIFGLTKGRIAILFTFLLSIMLFCRLYLKKTPFPKLITIGLLIFLFCLTIHSFLFHNNSFVDFIDKLTLEKNNSTISQTTSVTQEIKSLPLTSPKSSSQTIQKELEKTLETQYNDFNKNLFFTHWQTALVLFEHAPVLGVGTGLFYYSVTQSHKDILCEIKTLCPSTMQATDLSSTAHNIYLQILAEQGVIGIFIFITILVYLVYFFLQNKEDIFVLCLGMSIFCFLLQGLTFSYFAYPEMLYLFFLLLGLYCKKDKKK